MLQVTVNHIEDHEHPGMPYVAVVVNSHAANIHAYLTGYDGFEYFLTIGQAVIDREHRKWVD
jgi:hypothetical protein